MHGNLWFVANGVERLVRWGQGGKPVWNCIECTAITNPKYKPAPQQVRAEVWMSLIHGSRGLIYFVHQFKPRFDEAALLDDPEMLAAVTRINRQITQLAPVLNRPTAPQRRDRAIGKPGCAGGDDGQIIWRDDVSVCRGDARGRDRRNVHLHTGIRVAIIAVEVLGENRTLTATNGSFSDHFDPWAVHLYQFSPPFAGPLTVVWRRDICAYSKTPRTGLVMKCTA